NMIQQAQNKYPHIPFHVEDATALTDKNQFDAVFSNATLHWVKQPEQALQAIYNSLKTNGRFVAEFGAKGNVAKITNEIKAQAGKLNRPYAEEKFPWYLPSIGEYTTLMEKAGFHASFAQAFDRPTPLKGKDRLRNWINMFGQSMIPNLAEPTYLQLIQQIEANLQRSMYKNGHWIADYKRIRVIGIKQ